MTQGTEIDLTGKEVRFLASDGTVLGAAFPNADGSVTPHLTPGRTVSHIEVVGVVTYEVRGRAFREGDSWHPPMFGQVTA